ncbi:hypothetical protein DLAC_08045 [Tieghemostelium lacteum]|uniref:Uncharacterized protein n=1 Tax=Tieghemostelium lacteum TaxID=361077 RepID=A0A151ZB13_TIELA|nr:hypothetical protein DLAC_08045 [Tieghemostelium lacteum]|eukprot:KYQ91137.1 hypothetical protein DLAC_08045 [Tieghemostelium lacteum]
MGSHYSKKKAINDSNLEDQNVQFINHNQVHLSNYLLRFILSYIGDIKLSLVSKYWFCFIIPYSLRILQVSSNTLMLFISNYQCHLKLLYKNYLEKTNQDTIKSNNFDSKYFLQPSFSVKQIKLQNSPKNNLKLDLNQFNHINTQECSYCIFPQLESIGLRGQPNKQLLEFFNSYLTPFQTSLQIQSIKITEYQVKNFIPEQVEDFIRKLTTLRCYTVRGMSLIHYQIPFPEQSPIESICMQVSSKFLQHFTYNSSITRLMIRIESNQFAKVMHLDQIGVNLTHLTLNYMLLKEDEHYLQEAFQFFTNLKRLKLYQNFQEVEVEQMTRLIGYIQTIKTLKTLSFRSIRISANTIPSALKSNGNSLVCQLKKLTLLNISQHSDVLRYLCFNQNTIESLSICLFECHDITFFIQKSTSLQSLTLCGPLSQDYGEYMELIDAIQDSKSLKTLKTNLTFLQDVKWNSKIYLKYIKPSLFKIY